LVGRGKPEKRVIESEGDRRGDFLQLERGGQEREGLHLEPRPPKPRHQKEKMQRIKRTDGGKSEKNELLLREGDGGAQKSKKRDPRRGEGKEEAS